MMINPLARLPQCDVYPPAGSLFIRRNVRRLSRVCLFLGFDPHRCVRSLAGLPGFLQDAMLYARRSPSPAFRIRWLDLFPVIYERAQAAGSVGGHYFHQDLWAARKIFRRRPEAHIDIGSRIDGFLAHLLTFMPVTVIDIRPLDSPLPGLNFLRDDASRLECLPDDSIDSISTLHAAEHFGLGRYSDPIDPDACLSFLRSLERVLRPGGRLYFSVPVGRERVDFNAHRVFAAATIMTAFSRLTLVSFSFVDDAGRFHEHADPARLPPTEYGCGLFEFTKTQIEVVNDS
jgi:SAM-dependent methyltransferase